MGVAEYISSGADVRTLRRAFVEDTAALLGTLLVSQMAVTAFGRSRIPEAARRDFYLNADEFPSFTTSAVASLLAE